MKKSLFGIAAVAALAGIVIVGANLEAAGPVAGKKALMKQANDFSPLNKKLSGSAGVALDLDYTTGFEAPDFVARDATCVQDTVSCGPFSGECGWINGQGPGAHPEPWAVSTSNQGIGMIEGHVDTVNPFSGQQHLRISKDVCDSTNAFSFATDARVPASPSPLGIIGPSTYSGQIALTHGLFGANINWQPQSGTQGFLTSRMLFFFYGFFYILDDQGGGLGFFPVFTYWDAGGFCGTDGVCDYGTNEGGACAGGTDCPGGPQYREVRVEHDPCNGFICLGGVNAGGACADNSDCNVCTGGANDGLGCLGDFQCPDGTCGSGGDCVGRIDYYYDGSLIYSGSQYAGTTSEQFLIYSDNFPGNTDLDDLVVETGDPCPTTCGNLIVEAGEQCDDLNDGNCPGRCIAAGDTGPDGEGECTCIIDGETCDDATPLDNGTTTIAGHGGWWTFTADAEAVAVNTCGSDYDSALILYTGECASLAVLEVNDDCVGSGPYSSPYVDPLASCFPADAFPYESCFCFDVNLGQQYWVQDARVSIGDTTNITLEKRQTCGEIWTTGACCDGVTGACTDKVLEEDCLAEVGNQYVHNKLCSSDAVSCQITAGACCDTTPGAGDGTGAGACTDRVLEADCDDGGVYLEYSAGQTCADINCLETKGACCNGFTGTCSQTIQGDCQGTNMVWTESTSCSAVTCEAIPGACCNTINPDPLAREGVCTDGVIQADCQGEDLIWTKATLCSNVDCPATFQAIPTVSEWGLVVLALLLLVGAKVYFGRREAVA